MKWDTDTQTGEPLAVMQMLWRSFEEKRNVDCQEKISIYGSI